MRSRFAQAAPTAPFVICTAQRHIQRTESRPRQSQPLRSSFVPLCDTKSERSSHPPRSRLLRPFPRVSARPKPLIPWNGPPKPLTAQALHSLPLFALLLAGEEGKQGEAVSLIDRQRDGLSLSSIIEMFVSGPPGPFRAPHPEILRINHQVFVSGRRPLSDTLLGASIVRSNLNLAERSKGFFSGVVAVTV